MELPNSQVKSDAVQIAANALKTKSYKSTHRSFTSWLADSGLGVSPAACYYRANGRPILQNKPVVYFVRCKQANAIKIGTTTRLTERIDSLRIGCPFDLDVSGTINGDIKTEKLIHSKLTGWQIRGEWFHLNEFTKQVITEATDGRVRFDD